MKYAFHEIVLSDLDGKPLELSLHKFLANALYVHSKNLDLVDKAFCMNRGEEVELSATEIEQILQVVDDEKIGMAAFARKAIKDYLAK